MKSVAFCPLPVALGKNKSRLKSYLAFWEEFWQVKSEGSLRFPDHNVHQNRRANQHAANDSNLEETKEREAN